MDIPAFQPHVSATNLPLDRLAQDPKLSETEKIAEAGRQFEAILLRQILGEAMKPVFKPGVTGQSAQAGIYRDMVVNQLADNLTRSGGLGLARSLNGQLTRQLSTVPKPSAPTAHD